MPIPELVKAPVVAVQVPVQWYRLVQILLLATLLVAPVSGDVMTSYLPIDFTNSGWKLNKQPLSKDCFHRFPILLHPI